MDRYHAARSVLVGNEAGSSTVISLLADVGVVVAAAAGVLPLLLFPGPPANLDVMLHKNVNAATIPNVIKHTLRLERTY